MALGLTVANDIAYGVLTFYARGKALMQTMQQKPLVAWLKSNQKTFPGGKDYISDPVQGAVMADQAGFMQWYSEDDAATFAQAQNLLRAQVPWKEARAGLIISWTELKKDGISVTDSARTSDHSQKELVVLTDLLENRLDDYGESWARVFNSACWKDGTQDAKAMPGLLSILPDNAAAGTVCGLSQATYPWWRHRTSFGLAVSEANQSLTKFLRAELIQLTRYGGKPNKALCGSAFLDALMIEVQTKGQYSTEGFAKDMDMGMGQIRMMGLGTFEYDPTLDDMGYSKRCYIMDSRRIKLRPMEGEDMKVLNPDRPYNYYVFLKDMTWTGGMSATQKNCHGVYSVE